jgi:acetyl-CoA synthetase
MPADRYREVCAQHRWNVPADFNTATAVCRRYAHDRSRVALHWEDESGATATLTFYEVQEQANRLSNALAALGVGRGDKIAIILPQRPETAIAHIACYQLGAIAVPLSFLFGPDALEYRLDNSETKVALVDPASLPNLAAIRDRLPLLGHHRRRRRARGVDTGLKACGKGVDAVRARFGARDRSRASGLHQRYDGPPKGAFDAPAVPPQPSGVCPFARWFSTGRRRVLVACRLGMTGGLMDALLPTLYFGYPVVGYRGRFEPERALALMDRHRVKNAFLFPTALKMIMKTVPEPRSRYAVALRSIMSAGEAVGTTVFAWAQQALGVTINEMFGQTEMNYIVGNSHKLWPAKPGSMGRPYPGHRIAVIDDAGNEVATGEMGEVAVNRLAPDGVPDPVFFLEYFKNPESTAKKYTGDWCRTGDLAKRDDDGYLWYQGRSDDMFKAAGYRIGPSEIENCLVRHAAVANAAVVPSPNEHVATWSRHSSCSRPGSRRRRRWRKTSSNTCGSSLRPTSTRRRSSSSTRYR